MRLVLVAWVALQLGGCGNRCKEVARVRAALAQHGVANRGADVRVSVPYDHANQVIAGLLAQEPVTMELAPPQLRLFPVEVRPVAVVREARLQAGTGDTVRLAVRIEIGEGTTVITDLTSVIELRPVVVDRTLEIGFGPHSLVAVKPTLGPEAKATLGRAVERWVPDRLRARLPRLALDGAAGQLGRELTETGWEVLRGTLLKRLGDVSRLRLRLPDVPIARHQLHALPRGLIVDLETALPVRQGLAPASPVVGVDVGVRISGSAAAELANWAIDQGHVPQRYNRDLRPSPAGTFRPRFDYVAADRRHPLKVYAFQEEGGCSYHQVGVRGGIALAGDTVKVTAFDRVLEAQRANPAIESAAWAKFLFTGWVDRSKRAAAWTQLAVGNRTLVTRLTRATIVDDELVFQLALDAEVSPRPSSAGAVSSGAPSSRAPAARGTRTAACRTRC